jgi:hypothetical protein
VSASGSGDLLAANNLSELTATAGTARTNLGLGTTDTPTFKNLVISTGSIATSAPVTISQTWADVAQTFKALVVNAAGTSNANSASGSLLLDLQVGGVSKVYADKDGAIYGTGTVSGGTFKTWMNASGYYQVDRPATGLIFAGYPGQFFVPASSFIGWNATEGAGGAIDTKLFRDGAPNTLALRNSTAAQTFRVYNTFPGNGNNEFGSLNWVDQPNEFQITTGQGGSGTSRALCLRGQGGLNIRIGSAPGTLVWQVGMSTGHLLAGADDTYDIGTLTTNRPRAIYTSRYFYAGTDAGFAVASKAVINSPSDGVIKLNNWAINDFNRLQFGGTTSSFPALKRSTTYLQARLADDSAFAPIQGKLTTDTAYTGTTVVPTGFITLYDSTGTAYKVPCVAA